DESHEPSPALSRRGRHRTRLERLEDARAIAREPRIGAASTATSVRAKRPRRVLEDPPRRLRSDSVEELEDPEPRRLVGRVLRDPQEREHVLHVRRVEEAQASELSERDPPPSELDLEQVGVMGRPEKHGLLSERDPLLEPFEGRPDDDLDLARFVAAPHEERL